MKSPFTDDTLSDGLWTPKQAAFFIKCSTSYIYKSAERGTLPCIRIGRMLRFDPVAVRAFASAGASN